uniref:Uncharacterized protein n=1 Tax=Cyclopterus lumpus TaxID=8103 RepID=A0A8C2Z1U5_CYCLU
MVDREPATARARFVVSKLSFLSPSPGENCGCASPTNVTSGVVGAKPSHISVRKQQKEGRKVDIHLKSRTLHTHSSHERPHSLADFKMYKDTKVLVAKFLEHSSCSLPPEVQQVVNNIKCVIKSDEKHMEEAIFSANVIDQVTELDSMYNVHCTPAVRSPVSEVYK